MYSFYQWCIDNDKQKYLDLWDDDLNHIDCKNVGATSRTKYYFKCENGLHESCLNSTGYLIRSKDIRCPRCKSFYQWCIDNDDDSILYWDYNLNKEDPWLISAHSSKKCYFTINDSCTYLMAISNITSDGNSPRKKYLNSFGYFLIETFGEDAIDKYWSTLNKITPYDVSRRSTKQIYIICQGKPYHNDYKTIPSRFVKGSRCPMCAGKAVHPLDSFGQKQTDRYGDFWFEKCWCDDNKVDPFKIPAYKNKQPIHVRCMNVPYHTFWTTVQTYAFCSSCPYCGNDDGMVNSTAHHRTHRDDSLGMKYPEIVDIWSDKNEKSPYEYSPYSHKKIWLKCRDKVHDDYQQTISSYTANGANRCPACVMEDRESSYQKKFNLYMESVGISVLHEYECNCIPVNKNTNSKMPFDNELVGYNLIVEIHGIQHYELNGWHITQARKSGKTPKEEFEYQKWKDKYKKNYALSKGYQYLELPYYSFDDGSYIDILNNILHLETVETAG